jgi:hypothetical protein
MEIDVLVINRDKEFYECLFFLFVRDVAEESGLYSGTGGEFSVDQDIEFERLDVYIADFNSAFVGEENRSTFARGIDRDVG